MTTAQLYELCVCSVRLFYCRYADGTEIEFILLVNNQTFVFLTEPVC